MAVAKNDNLDWLPTGWKVEDKVKNGRKVRCFVNANSSQRLYSKAAVLRHVRKTRMNNQRSHSQLSNGPVRRSSRNEEMPLPKESNDCLDWLPPGWTTEVRTRKSGPKAGTNYKCFTDPSTGNTFYSKPEVSRYLKGKEQRTGSSGRKESGATVDSSVNGSVRPLRDHKPDPGEKEPQHPESVEEKIQPSKTGMGSVHPLRHHKPDPGEKEPQHPEPVEEKIQPSKTRLGSVRPLRHHKPDPGEKEIQHPESTEEKIQPSKTRMGSIYPLRHQKADPGEKELQHPESVEEKIQPSKTRMGSIHPLGHHKADPVQKVTQPPKSQEGKSQLSKKRKVIVEMVVDEGLPPGWIKEIRIKKSSNGVRKDPFYSNPATGYVFRSRLEVLRYLETGEISRHAYKRRDSGINIVQSTQGSPSASAVRSNTTKGTTKKRLFTAKGSPEGSSLPNCGNSKLWDTGSGGVLAGNNALFDLEADVDRLIPIEAQMPEGNEIDAVHIVSGPTSSLKDNFLEKKHEGSNQANTLAVETESATIPSKNEPFGAEQSKDKEECGKSSSRSSERKLKRNRKALVSPRRSSRRLEGIEVDTVHIMSDLTSSLKDNFLEKKHEGSNEANTLTVETQCATKPSKNALLKDNEECGNRNSMSSEIKPKKNRKEIVSPRRSSNRLAGIEVEPVTHSMTIERVLRSASSNSAKTEAMPSSGSEQGKEAQDVPLVTNVVSQEEIVCQYNTESATIPSKNEFFGAERSNDKEECGKRSSKNIERKPKRNRKEIVLPRRSSKRLEGIEVEPVTHSMAIERVLRSASSKSTKTEAVQSSGSEQVKQAQEAPLVNNVGSQEEIVPAASILPEDQATQATLRSNITHQTVMIDFSWNNIGGQMTVEPSRNNFEDQMVEEPPKNNSKERFITDDLTTGVEINGREREQQDSQFSFPWSDPCIEFAYKTLTGALPLDDTLAIHDYVQHQIRTSSNSSNNFTLADARPPGFCLNTIPSNSGNDFTLQDARPPGFCLNTIPSNSSCNFTLPDARPPGFCLNTVPSNSSGSITLPDARPPGFCLNTVPSNSSNSFTLPDPGPPGFSQNIAPSNSSINLAFPDVSPPGFSQNIVPSNRDNNLAFPDAMPPGFSLNTVPSNRDNLTLPDAGPPGFSRSSVSSHSGNNFALPDAKPPGFSWASVPSNSGINPALPDARPPGFSRDSVPSNSGINPALPDVRPPGFSRGSVPSHSGINSAIPDARPPGFSRASVPSNSGINTALPDARPPGFSWGSVPSNSGINPALPDASPPGFSWSGASSNSGINLNLAFPDVGPPGFSHKIVPSSKQQQQSNTAGPHTHPADFPLQRGTMFSSWDLN